MATLRQLEAAVRRRYGKYSYVQHNPTARDTAGRERLRVELGAIRDRLEAIGKSGSTDTVRKAWEALLKAAEFVTDTDGDRTAVEALGKEVERGRVLRDRLAEQAELYAEKKRLTALLHKEPYEVFKAENIGGGLSFGVWMCSGDTIDEVLTKVRNRQKD